MPGVPTPPGYVRPDPVPSPHLPTLKKSGAHILDDGSTFRYSTLPDYVEHYVAQGLVRDCDDLINNFSHLIPEIFFHWVGTGQLGCLFASFLARKPRENRWVPIVQLNALTMGRQLGALLNASLDAAGETYEAAVVIFPGVVTETEIVTLINNLCECPSKRWYITDAEIDPDPSGTLHLIGIRWILKESTSVNYVLGFASIATMPFTRHSPFTALFLRIREEKRTPPHREDGRVQVHLADLDSTFPSQKAHDRVLEETKKHRAKLVEATRTPAARARVAFSVSPAAAANLCPVRKVVIEKDGQ